jgi:hypothetical protein
LGHRPEAEEEGGARAVLRLQTNRRQESLAAVDRPPEDQPEGRDRIGSGNFAGCWSGRNGNSS